MSWRTHESTGLDPDCLLLRLLLLLFKSKSELQMIFWKTFLQIGESDASR